MRHLTLRLMAMGSLFCITACVPSFDAAEKNNKAEIQSGRDEVSTRLAMASEQGGDLASAERNYQQIVKTSGGSRESVLQLASFYTRNGKSARAAALLEPLHTSKPQDMVVLRAYANSLIGAGEAERALTLLDGAIATHDTDAYLYNSRGVALDRLGKFSEAHHSYRKAIALSPADEMDFKTNLGMSSILAGEYNDAIELLQPLLGDKDVTPQVRQNLALAYGLQGNMDAAMKVGSKDLSIKEMNDNIRFYQLMAKNSGTRHKAAVATPITTPDIFPIMPAVEQQAEAIPVAPPAETVKKAEIIPPPSVQETAKTEAPVLKETSKNDQVATPTRAILMPPSTKTPPAQTIPEAALNPSSGGNNTASATTENEPQEDEEKTQPPAFSTENLPVPEARPQWE